MAQTPKPKLLSLHIQPQTVQKLLRYEAHATIEKFAEELLPEIKDIYKDADGNSYNWTVKSYFNNRAKRMYTVVTCDNPEARFKEAKFGKIAKKIRSLTTKSAIRVAKQPDGSFKLL